jgi:hypothetical protein
MSTINDGALGKSTNDNFTEEFTYFVICRGDIRRFMPTPDRFPLFCELVEAAKKHYVSLSRKQRNTLRYIPFFYFGREWLLRVRFVYAVRPGEFYIDFCNAPSKIVLATVPVLVVEQWDSP